MARGRDSPGNFSLSSHNSSEKKVRLRLMDLRGAGGTHPAAGGVQGRSPAWGGLVEFCFEITESVQILTFIDHVEFL
jgi:hypothetical protein